MDPGAAGELHETDGVADWRVLDAGMSAWFDAPSMTAGAGLVHRIAALVDGDAPPGTALPDVDLRADGLRVRVGAGVRGGAPGADQPPTAADVDLARGVSAAARDLGLLADPAALHTLHLAVDTADRPAVGHFWQTVLAYEPTGAGLADPSRRNPAISFHDLGDPRPLRNRVHVDVVRAADEVEAARAELGLSPYGAYGLTLADAEGNEVDLVPGDPLGDGPATADWRVLFSAMTYYPVTSGVRASELVAAVAGLCDDAGVPLLVDLRPDGVTLDSGKDRWDAGEFPSAGGFVELAGRVQAAARGLGHTADPTRLRFVQLGIDAVDVDALRAFWTSLLGYRHDPRAGLTDIHDPRRLDPVLMFQDLDAADDDRRAQRGRIHVDLVVPHDSAAVRVDTALAAGGRLVSSSPVRHSLVDPEGNAVDVVVTRR